MKARPIYQMYEIPMYGKNRSNYEMEVLTMKFKKILAPLLACALLMASCTAPEEESVSSSPAADTGSTLSLPEPMPEESAPVASEVPLTSSEMEQNLEAQANVSSLPALDNQKLGWGQGTNKNGKNQPVGCLDYQEKYGKYDAHFIESDEKIIYLTFDEGYENGYTSQILDVLKEKEAKAVFFITYDYAKRNPELVQRMIDEGHAVGNHTWSHPSMPEVSLEQAQDEVLKLHEYVRDHFQYEMTLFRFPKGEFSEQTLALLQSLNYQSVFWSYAYADWDPDKQMEPAAALKKLTDNCHDGAIYLLHAVSKTNAEVLGQAIDGLRSKGYTLELFR